MDCTPPDNTSNRGCVKGNEVVFFRNPWLFLGIVFILATLIVVGVFALRRLHSGDGAHIHYSSISKNTIKKMFADAPVVEQAVVDTVSVASNLVEPKIVTVRPKDSLNRIFKRLGLDTKYAGEILKLKRASSLKSVTSGRKLKLVLDPSGTKIQELTYGINDLDTLVVSASNNGWSASINHIDPVTTIRYVSANIKNSIYAAGKNAGIPKKLMAQLVSGFKNKVNVNRLREGDSFAMFYREHMVNGRKIGDNEIVAAEIVHSGEKERIIGFADKYGVTNFYTPDGRSVNPAFIRYPINFKRIGSRFSFARMHPILGFSRPHLGVDLVARTGTPIKATSGGRVEFASFKGGYGRTIILKKGPYKTLYAHLSKFAKGIHTGKYVKQGEVIGYVGASGLATGSHLHYEFHANGIPRDPMRVKLPSGEMIEPEYRRHFFALSKKMVAQLDLYHKNNKMFASYFTSKFE